MPSAAYQDALDHAHRQLVQADRDTTKKGFWLAFDRIERKLLADFPDEEALTIPTLRIYAHALGRLPKSALQGYL